MGVIQISIFTYYKFPIFYDKVSINIKYTLLCTIAITSTSTIPMIFWRIKKSYLLLPSSFIS